MRLTLKMCLFPLNPVFNQQQILRSNQGNIMAHLDLPTQPLSHPLLGIYQNKLQILGDIIEPVFDEKEWENTDNEFAQIVDSQTILKLLE